MDLPTLLLILAALGAAYYFWRQSRPRSATPPPSPDPVIENVRPGGTIQLRGVGPDLEDFDLVIKARHTYDEDGWKWYELEGEKGTQPVWIEIEEDDETEISICLEKLALADLGITGPDAETIAQQGKGQVQFRETTFTYEEHGKARFFRNSDLSGSGVPFHYWDFASTDSKQYLAIERWGSAEYVAYLSEPLRRSQIEVFSVS